MLWFYKILGQGYWCLSNCSIKSRALEYLCDILGCPQEREGQTGNAKAELTEGPSKEFMGPIPHREHSSRPTPAEHVRRKRAAEALWLLALTLTAVFHVESCCLARLWCHRADWGSEQRQGKLGDLARAPLTGHQTGLFTAASPPTLKVRRKENQHKSCCSHVPTVRSLLYLYEGPFGDYSDGIGGGGGRLLGSTAHYSV